MIYNAEKLIYTITDISEVIEVNMTRGNTLNPLNEDIGEILKNIKLPQVVEEFTNTVLLNTATTGIDIKGLMKEYNTSFSVDNYWNNVKLRPNGFAHNLMRNLIEILIELNIDKMVNFYFIDNMFKISIKYKIGNTGTISKYGLVLNILNNAQDNNTSDGLEFINNEIIVSFNKDLLYKSRDGYAITIEERDR